MLGSEGSHPALKHSWPQKKDPGIPNLQALNGRGTWQRESITYLLHVGHSRRDGGRSLMQVEL